MPVTNMPVVWVSKPRLRVSWLHVLAAAEGLQDVVPQLGAPPFPLPDGVLGEGWFLTYTGTQCKKVYTEWGL